MGGAQEVVRRISEEMVAKGSDVTVATSKLPERTQRVINGVKIDEFAISGNAIGGFTEATPGECKRYQEFLVNGHFDVMMNYAAQQWATDLAFPELERIPYRKVLAPCGFSALYDPQYASYFDQMPSLMRKYDRLIFHSNGYRDIDFARAHSLAHYTVIPNGASKKEFLQANESFRQKFGIGKDTPLLLTVGSHTGSKGHDVAIEAFRRARIGRSVLVIIGNVVGSGGCKAECWRRAAVTRLLSLGQKRVLLLDLPRADVLAAFRAADLFVFASNIECSPLVLFEAMAARTAFLTTACGNAQEIVDWSGGGLVMPSHQKPDGRCVGEIGEATQMLEHLIHNPNERTRLAESGYNAWQERFTWERIAVEYERVYESVLGR
jgi:glycosyltransferase involved in cell wall biosynthesis